MKTTILAACMSAALMTSVAIANEPAKTPVNPNSTPTSTPMPIPASTPIPTSTSPATATLDSTDDLTTTDDQNMMTSGSESEAIAVLMAVNDHEVKSAQMALDKDPSTALAEYAQMLHDEHTGNQEKTVAFADMDDAAMLDSPTVDALNAKSAAKRNELSALEGDVFESAFIDAMVQNHIDVLAKIDNELLPKATDAEFAQHLRMTRTHIAKHLEHARKLDSRLQASR